MATFTNLTLTQAAANLIAQYPTGTQIGITAVQVGSGNLSGDLTLASALAVPKQTATMTSANALVFGQTTIRFRIVSTMASSAYNLSEVGVYAQLFSTGTPILFAYASIPIGTGNTIDPASPITRDYAILINYAQSASINPTVTLTPALQLHASSHITGGLDPLPVATSTSTGVTPITPADTHKVLLGGNPASFGPVPLADATHQGAVPSTPSDQKQVLLGGASPSFGQVPIATVASFGGTSQLLNTGIQAWFDDASWKPVTPVIVVNTTLYVATSGNNSTAIPNDASHPWANIQGAHTWLINYQIQPGVTVTISVGAGVYNSATPISIYHPQGQNIQIIGSIGSPISAPGASMSGTLVSLTAGVGGAFSGISANDYILASSLTTINSITESGVYKVVGCNGTTLTYTSSGGSAISLSGATFTVTKLQSVLTFSAGIQGIVVAGNGLGSLQNFAIVGTQSGSTVISGLRIQSSAFASIQNIGLTGWKDSVNVSSSGIICSTGGNLNANTCYANGNVNGILSLGLSSSISCINCYSNFNTCGYWSNSSDISCTGSYACGNGSRGGWFANGNATIGLTGPQCIASYNTFGIAANSLSSIIVTTVSGLGLTGNTTDVALSISSVLTRSDGVNAINWATKTSNITAVRTLTADGCYFNP